MKRRGGGGTKPERRFPQITIFLVFLVGNVVFSVVDLVYLVGNLVFWVVELVFLGCQAGIWRG